MAKKLKFPEGFLWGSSTSAHQVEGNNRNNWSEWEKENAKRLAKTAKDKWAGWQQEKFPEMFQPENYISGQACDHYNRYEKDFDIIQKLGHNAHRFSIEWSRIEPEEGKFNEKEIEHYRKVILALREKEIEPFITLWHWTNPLWLTKKGGELSQDFPQYFLRYTKLIVSELGDLVNFWITINEPTSVIANSYVNGVWPPQKRNLLLALKVYKNLAKAHNKAFDGIHKIYPKAKVGLANILTFYEAYNDKSILDKITVRVARYLVNEKFLNLTKGKHDFLAVQYYFHNRLKFIGKVENKNKIISDLG
ncbi:MAG TPA: glycoside hydrolase family 1 protein, partial [Candidatus Moranbacteria bacterium]|nr:glycoside hydrolase family 1 protein [Candidatus Moranbacteria bacterium]